ncbi:hypothetical protein ABZ499_34250 [Streptomyces sp. NPDC019990]|uniref:hypothetical protein n=1 Tax=Streptomyces sp. NPDC019990 TaxID=3154693 RepID=UPI0033E302FF
MVDTPARHARFAVGSALIVLAWALPALLGPSKVTLVAVMLISGLGNSFAGESAFKVWSQELFLTLLRATASGVTIAFTRAVAGLTALGTPAFALVHARVMFVSLFGLVLLAAVIGLVWVPRLLKALPPEEPTTPADPAPETTARATK